MRKILLLIIAPFAFLSVLSAQITQQKADEIVLQRMLCGDLRYTVYAKNFMQQEGTTITTSAGETLELDYPCWIYYIRYATPENKNPVQGRYLIVHGNNGNLIEVKPKDDYFRPNSLFEWRIAAIETALKGTQWELAGIVDAQTGVSTELRYYHTLAFYSEWGAIATPRPYSGVFGALYDTYPYLIEYVADYITNSFQFSYIPSMYYESVFGEIFPVIESFSLQDNKLRLYYNDKKNYLLYNRLSYNPCERVALTSFSPLSGDMYTQVTLTGENFGDNLSIVKVYFNQKPAVVLSLDNNKIVTVPPWQPGDKCVISVVIGKDSVWYDQKFINTTPPTPLVTSISTLVGRKGTTEFKAGSFNESTFAGNGGGGGYRGIRYLTVDDNCNLFLCHQDNPNGIIFIDQKNKTVTALELNIGNRPNVPVIMDNEVVLIPADGGDPWTDVYWEIDPLAMWTPRPRRILHPTKEQQDELGIEDFYINAYKHSFAYCKYDGMVYLRSNRDGTLIKFDPITRLGQPVVINNVKQTFYTFTADSYLVFDPNNPTRLYAANAEIHCIHYFDILTGETGVYAGKQDQTGGWKDGRVEDALFNRPRQMAFDAYNNLLVADSQNHCIRRINTKTGMVETIAGVPEKRGYSEALFDTPWGIAVDKDGVIYVADCGNQCIRKIKLEKK